MSSGGLPAGLVGAWMRESIALGDGEPAEAQTVRYLQARRSYADLRIDLEPNTGSGATCFAGTTSWTEPWASWAHDLDLDPRGGADRGEIEWLEGGGMAERGTFDSPDGPLAYTEVWRPLPVGDGGLLALSCASPPGQLVRVGAHAIVVRDDRAEGGTFAARYDRLEHGTWTATLHLGDAAALPAPPADHPEVGASVELGGMTWTVDESATTVDAVGATP